MTKRTDLLYFLRSIAVSSTDMRELMQSIFARQSENSALIERFTTVAASLYGNDEGIRNFILNLCASKSSRVRKAAFRASFNTGIFMQNYTQMKQLFLHPENESIRKGMILEAATALGRRYVSAINTAAALDGVRTEDVLDLDRFFDIETARFISAAMLKRDRDIQARIGEDSKVPRRSELHELELAVSSILMLQEEVLSLTPILKMIFAVEDPNRARSARSRLDSKRSREQRAAADRAVRSFGNRSRW